MPRTSRERTVTRWTVLLALCAALFVMPAVWAEQEADFLNRSINLNGVEYRYAIYVPRDWSPVRRWPVGCER